VPRYDPQTASCLVFTYKEGLLSKVAHDLQLRVDRFQVDVDPDGPTVRAHFDAASLVAVCAMRDGEESPDVLPEKDLRDIERRMTKDVLHPRKHPEIRFRSTLVEPSDDGFAVQGLLALHGRERRLRFDAVAAGDRLVAEVPLDQREFEIKPYSALLGTLKVKPVVLVRVELPAP